jgi:Mg2+/Co2+ transporter CorC
VNLRDLDTQMNWHLPRSGGVETLAGFLLTRLGKIPTGEETVDFEGRRFTVLEMSDHRISRVRVEPLENQAEEAKRGGAQNPGVGQTDLIKADVVARAQSQADRKEG